MLIQNTFNVHLKSDKYYIIIQQIYSVKPLYSWPSIRRNSPYNGKCQ